MVGVRGVRNIFIIYCRSLRLLVGFIFSKVEVCGDSSGDRWCVYFGLVHKHVF